MTDGWQDMATAPRDGTVFIAWDKYELGEPVLANWYGGDTVYPPGWEVKNMRGDYIEPFSLSHWMHPQPPAQTQIGRKMELLDISIYILLGAVLVFASIIVGSNIRP